MTKRELIKEIRELCRKLGSPLSPNELKTIRVNASHDELIELRAKLELLLALKENKWTA